jgi:hypothetical protein
MKNDATWLLERLPKYERVWRRSEPDFYGASYLIAEHLGKKKPPISFATWRHGWVYYNSIIHPEFLTNGTTRTLNLVATEQHVQLLKKFGYKKSVAVGLPYLYGDSVQIERRPNSLLVMPKHTLPYLTHQMDQKKFADQIAKLKTYFSTIVVCVHSSCFSNGLWISEFEKHGIPWIMGADTYDKNALERLHCIFDSFEYMTTNTIGSHIAYAAYSGVKVSIYGEYLSFTEKDHRNNPFYKDKPDLLKSALKYSKKDAIQNQYPFLFVTPMEAKVRTNWGKEVTGADYKRSPSEIAELLGWSLKSQIKGYLTEGCRLMCDPESLRKLLERRKIA